MGVNITIKNEPLNDEKYILVIERFLSNKITRLG